MTIYNLGSRPVLGIGTRTSPNVRRRIQAHGINIIPSNFYSNVPSVDEIEHRFPIGAGGMGPARPEASRATEAPLERMRTAAPSASVVGLEGMALASCVSRA